MIAACLAWMGVVSSSSHAAEQKAPFSEEQREVDALVGKADSVELRKLSPRIFQLAERLLAEKGDAEARRYFEKGLEGNSWALPQQLTLGEILARGGQPQALREKAEMVLRLGEDDELLARASRLIGRDLPEKPVPFAGVQEPDMVLVLVPLGPVGDFTLQELRGALAKRLSLKVVVASVDVPATKADRTFRDQWVVRTREKLLKVIQEQPALAAQLGRMGFTFEQIKTSDEALISLVRKTTEMEQGAAALQSLDAALADYERTMQWDVMKMISSLHAACGSRVGPRELVLGITPHDIYMGTSNFLFGAGSIGSFVGVISTHRFSAAFNEEAPKRERFNERLLKQSLSTIGFMIGVPRCTTPECTRAFPQSMAEHDQKPSTLCPACQAGFEKFFGKRLSRE